jgi:uncharacterized protein YaaR (DUF327 family)
MQRIGRAGEAGQNVPTQARTDRSAGPSAAGSFQGRLVEAHKGAINERIDQAIKQIDELGARLAQTLAMPDMRRYRQAVGALLHDLTSQMVQVKTQMEWDSQSWEHRTLVTIKKVNQEMEELTELLLAQEKDRLSILEKIGEIKGMLLDVRM